MAQIFKPSANTVAKLSLILAAAAPVVLIFAGSTISRSSANTKVTVPLEQPVPFSHQHHAFELGIDCRYCHTTVERSSFAGFPSTEICMSCHSQIWTNSPLLEPVRKSLETGKPLIWNKVNKVPEFVYFNHSIHVKRGISCNTCHGPVQKMPLMYKGRAFQMAWCLTCHNQPEKYVYKDPKNKYKPGRAVFERYWKYQKNSPLNAQEQEILAGNDLAKNSNPKEMAEHVKLMGVKTRQLQDCSVCHR